MGTDNTDLDSLRQIYESDEMWNLRRKFMETYWNDRRFTKNRLYCLAQMLVNMEFLGCTYNEALMSQVNEMANDMVQSRRVERKAIIEKVFLKAKDNQGNATTTANNRPNLKRPSDDDGSSAIGAKKQKESADMVDLGGGFWRQLPSPETPETVTNLKSMQLVKAQLSIAPSDCRGVQLMNFVCNRLKFKWAVEFVQSNICQLKVEDVLIVKLRHSGDEIAARTLACEKSAQLLQKTSLDVRRVQDGSLHLFTSRDVRQGWNGPDEDETSGGGSSSQASYGGDAANFLNDFVLFEIGFEPEARKVLHDSASMNKCKLEYVDKITNDKRFRYIVKLNNIRIASVKGSVKKEVKEAAGKMALKKLRETNYTIIIKNKIDPNQSAIEVGQPGPPVKIFTSGLAEKLMSKMGWSGGGIGKNEQGIKEPVQMLEYINRGGLGSTVTKTFKQAVRLILEDYANSDKEDELVFSFDLSNPQRKLIHQLASKLHLKSKSYNVQNNRQLTLKKNRSPSELLKYLLDIGGENGKYKVVHPNNKT